MFNVRHGACGVKPLSHHQLAFQEIIINFEVSVKSDSIISNILSRSFGFALTRSWMSSCPPPSCGCWACNNDTQSVHLSTQVKVLTLTSFCRSASLSSWRTRGCMQRRRRSRTPPARMAAEGRKHHFALLHSLRVPSNKYSYILFVSGIYLGLFVVDGVICQS